MTQDVQQRTRPGWLLLGPAFVAAIAYVDPGNVAANVSAGAQFGFLLVWVIVVANLMACLVQYLSAKLGPGHRPVAAGGRRDQMRHDRPGSAYWVQAELVAMATDLAEVVGGAIALYLLFDLPLLVGGVITGVVSLLLLVVQDRRGQRMFERVITGLLLVIAIGFLTSLFVRAATVGEVAAGLVPRFDGAESVLLATAMLGATVMPHAVYLHSGLARDRHGHPDAGPAATADCCAPPAGTSASRCWSPARSTCRCCWSRPPTCRARENTDSIEGAHDAVQRHPRADRRAALRDRPAGLRAGVDVGRRLRRRDDHAGVAAHGPYPLLVRRLITLMPALVILASRRRPEPRAGVVAGRAVVRHPVRADPAGAADQRSRLMGADTNHRVTTALGWVVAGVISLLNVVLIYLTVTG